MAKSEAEIIALFRDGAHTTPQLCEMLGIPAEERKSRDRISDILRRLVRKGYLVKSKHRKKHGAFYYGKDYEQVLEAWLINEMPPEWTAALEWLDHARRPVLLADFKKQFKLEDPRWELNKQLRILEDHGQLVRGTINRWQYIRHPQVALTEEDKQQLSRQINFKKRLNALKGNLLERRLFELIKEGGLQSSRREVTTRRHYENEQGETLEFDIVEKVFFGDGAYELNLYSVKSRTVGAIDVYQLEDRVRTFYNKAVVSRKILIAPDAGKSAWDAAKRRGILLLPVHRLLKTYSDDAILKEVKAGVLEAARLKRHEGKIEWEEAEAVL